MLGYRRAAAAALCCAASLFAADWPQWRGPFFNGSTEAENLPASLKEAVLWTAPMPGRGASTPIVWRDRVFVTSTDRATGELCGLCLDVATGGALWKITAGEDRRVGAGNTMATPSPATDGAAVYFMFGTSELIAVDFGGKTLWRRALEKDHGEFVIQFGYSASPLLYKGKLYVSVLQNKTPGRYRASDRAAPLESFLLAIDPASGADLWKQVRPSDTIDESSETYATPIPCEEAGRAVILVPSGEFLTGHDAATGAEVWRWDYPPRGREDRQRLIPSIVPGAGLVYEVRGRGSALLAIKTGAIGAADGDALAWRLNEACPDEATPLLYRGKLFVLDGAGKKMTCVDAATGTRVWQGRLGGGATWYASPTGADGKIYCLSDRGETLVLSAGPSFEILSRGRLEPDPGSSRSSIAIAGGKLFIRTEKTLFCAGVRAETR